jgi:uncharacterized membrane protein (UPF0127 family)
VPAVRAWLLVVAFGCSSSEAPAKLAPPPPPQAPDTRPTVTFGNGASVRVEVVDTEPKIERGLMYREHLPPDDGMLFLLQIEQDWKFWMRNTLIPLDIIFITRDLTVAGVAANAEPRTDTLRSVGVPSLYVVEVNGGWCATHHVAAGSPVKFDGVTLHPVAADR